MLGRFIQANEYACETQFGRIRIVYAHASDAQFALEMTAVLYSGQESCPG